MKDSSLLASSVFPARLGAIAALVFFAGFSLPSVAETVGKVKKMAGSVTIERAGKPQAATSGMGIEVSDVIRTGAASSVGITTSDNALVSLGPNSALTVTQYSFNPTTHEGKMAAALAKGSLSMVSGKLTKQSPESVKITTPTAVLAVRGTEFFAEVEDKK